MRNPMVVATLLVGIGWVNPIRAEAQSSRYALDVRDAKDDDLNKIVSLRDKKLKRILWTRKVYSPQITWSKDKRAVVVEGAWHFLVWRERDSLRDFGTAGFKDIRYDYTMGCVWSPDNRRLLIRFGLSGMADADAGRLFCLRLGRGKTYHYSHVAGGVREMKWRDSRTVLYRLLNYETGTVSRQYRWRIR